MKLEELASGLRVTGVVPHEVVQVIFAQPHGADAMELTYKTASGDLGQQVLFRRDEEKLAASASGSRAFDAEAAEFKLVAEAQRIKLAGIYDPMLAVATSAVQPLPHQIRAVYGELLPRTPLRFLLADDPGAGKTIMAGLFIKELILREDVQRCLVVAPGGLVEQWQDELFFKFGLSFEILTGQMIDAGVQPQHVREARSADRADGPAGPQRGAPSHAPRESHWDLVDRRRGAPDGSALLRRQAGEDQAVPARRAGRRCEQAPAADDGDPALGQGGGLPALPQPARQGPLRRQEQVLDVDTTDVMRRMIKEDLLTFEGRRLFPERIAESVPYQLTALENELYEQVTDYVRNGMNRAPSVDGKRRNSVGFALTVLQRRLASSPEAIYRSLVRRTERLEMTKKGSRERRPTVTTPTTSTSAAIDEDDYSAAEVEELEETSGQRHGRRTIAELEAEIAELRDLASDGARRVRESGDDQKWSELSQILQDNIIPPDAAAGRASSSSSPSTATRWTT